MTEKKLTEEKFDFTNLSETELLNKTARLVVALKERGDEAQAEWKNEAEGIRTAIAELGALTQERDARRAIESMPTPYVDTSKGARGVIQAKGLETQAQRTRRFGTQMSAQDARALRFQELNDSLRIASVVLRKTQPEFRQDAESFARAFPGEWAEFTHLAKEFTRATMDTQGTAEGLEFMPTDMSPRLWEKFRLALKVPSLFQEIQQPTNPWKFPIVGTDAVAYGYPEQTTSSPTKMTEVTPATGNRTWTAYGFGARTITSRELDMASIIPIVPFIENALVTAHAIAQERGIIDGDTTTVHMDTDVTGYDARKYYIGLRKATQTAAKKDLSVFNLTNCRALRGLLSNGRGLDLPNLAWITGISAYLQMLSFEGVKHVYEYGPAATVVTGELAKLDGIPLVATPYVREDLNDSAVYELGATKTVVHLVHTKDCVRGKWEPLKVVRAEELYVESWQIAIVSHLMESWNYMVDYTADYVVAMGYNIEK